MQKIITIVCLGIFINFKVYSLGRTPVFPGSILFQHSATDWYAQDFVFKRENLQDKKRPIWVLAGDSISAAWSSGSSLEERYKSAFEDELPIPNTIKDLLTQMPSAETNWYAGSKNEFGVFGFLAPDWSHSNWPWSKKPNQVVVATAFAGALLLPEIYEHNVEFIENNRDEIGSFGRFDYDTLELFHKIQNKERVKLVTMSLGSNDLCDGLDVYKNENLIRNKLRKIKSEFAASGATYAVWKIPQLDEIYSDIRVAISQLPEYSSDQILAKDRLKQYCTQSWKTYCPATANLGRLRMQVKRMNEIYGEELGDLFDARLAAQHPVDKDEVLGLVSRDCFHPSANTQRLIKDRMIRYLQKHGY